MVNEICCKFWTGQFLVITVARNSTQRNNATSEDGNSIATYYVRHTCSCSTLSHFHSLPLSLIIFSKCNISNEQMFSMSKLSSHVIPIIYQYPGASLLTFRWAELICATEQNQKHFLQMLKGLRQEGIQNVHFLTHSLGVEPLMNAFEESTDGTNSCAALFVTAPTSRPDASTTTYSNRNSMADVGKLVCRSITLMNPAFPLDAFRERGFRSLRKVTPLITIIGDTTDFALLIGAVENGFCNWWGLPKPALLDSKTEQNQQGFHLQGQIGREIMSIYFDRNDIIDNNDDEDGMVFRRSSQKQQRVISSSSSSSTTTTNNNDKKKKKKATKSDSSGEALALTGEDYLENKKKTKKAKNNNKNRKKYWMDCDVINTTGLDTNVNDVRHSAFSMNSILIRDIEELIVQCKRAGERSSLLHVEGNVYEYCHAPSYVKPE